MATPDMMRPYAEGILPKVLWLRRFKDRVPDIEELSNRSRRRRPRAREMEVRAWQRLRESISGDIQKASNLHPHHFSRGALAHERCRGLDLSSLSYHERNSFDKKPHLLMVEHMMTVNDLRGLCLRSETADEIVDVLVNRICVVWVLKDENDRIPPHFKETRASPWKVYEHADIKLASVERCRCP